MIKLASYNIRKCIGTDRRRNPDRILEVLAELDPDIVALQEADRRFGPRQAAIPHILMETHSAWSPVPLANHDGGMGWHGNAILARKGSTVLSHDRVHLPCLEPRGAVRADIAVDGNPAIRIFGMHLDLSGLWRRRQAAAVIHAAERELTSLPTVLMGDLNDWSANSGCLRDFARHFSFAPSGRSYHARRPVARLDRIMHNGALKLVDCGVHDTPAARRASDHLPIWAVFEAE